MVSSFLTDVTQKNSLRKFCTKPVYDPWSHLQNVAFRTNLPYHTIHHSTEIRDVSTDRSLQQIKTVQVDSPSKNSNEILSTAEDYKVEVIASRPKKTYLQLFRKRMWTDMDFLHIHAISGVVYSVLGTWWLVRLFYDQLTLGDQASVAPGAGAMALLIAGLINCASCIPMSKFNPKNATGDLKGDGFKNLGVGMTTLAIWLSYWFSGFYPNSLHFLDTPLALAGFGTILWGIHTSETALAEELEGVDLSTTKEHNGESISDIIINHRVASYPNLLHLPCIYNVAVGGQDWWLKINSQFPMQPVLLFHACFALGVGNSIIFLGATLKDRNLMTLRQWLYMQVIALVPFVSTIIDVSLYSDTVSLNPLELYAGFI
mmetsp:Transcript_5710/g.7876  ORF Transcript_5710/g.7876 Transcript_5710/m.7876 type:complete len:373 (+) Transcript_5710:25-1143(+)